MTVSKKISALYIYQTYVKQIVLLALEILKLEVYEGVLWISILFMGHFT